MGQPLSMDLRTRSLAAIDGGMSRRAAAARFEVAPPTAIRWQSQQSATGSCAAKPQGGDVRSHRFEARRDEVLALWEACPDITLDELRVALAGIGLSRKRQRLRFVPIRCRLIGIRSKEAPGSS